jgi:hypothetical protein
MKKTKEMMRKALLLAQNAVGKQYQHIEDIFLFKAKVKLK